MKQNFEYRKEALDLLKGNWGKVVLLFFIFSLVYVVTSTILANILPETLAPIGNLVITLFVSNPLAYILSFKLLTFGRDFNPEGLQISTLLDTFKAKYSKATPLMGLMVVYVMLWSLLLLIPGIIKSYSYAMAPYISMDNEELSAEECINRSMKMMEGHKMKLFLLDLSFFGWAILSILTLGIGFLWLAPYQETSHIRFYEDLKNQPQQIEE